MSWRKAIKYNNTDIMLYLLDNYNELLSKSFTTNYNPQYHHDDFEKCSLDTVKLLLRVPWKSNFYKIMLCGLSWGHNIEGINELIISGHDKNEILIEVLNSQHLDIIRLVVESGADIKIKEVSHALNHMLFFHIKCKLIRYLLNSGGKSSISDDNINKKAKICLKCAHSLIESGFRTQKFIEEVLEMAVKFGNVDFISFLINTIHIDFNTCGENSVMLALKYEQLEMAKFLIEHGAPIISSKKGKLNMLSGTLHITTI